MSRNPRYPDIHEPDFPLTPEEVELRLRAITPPKPAETEAEPPPRPPRRRRRARAMSLSLRWAVLTRDNFRCVACGRSPATELGCKLHVDHIVPVSKGGGDRFDNLRTLCAECNIGRGNRE